MSDVYFPTLPGLQFPVRKTPIWLDVPFQTTASGREFGVSSETYPRWQWDLQYEFLRSDATWAELQSLVGFFLMRVGQADSFLFTDPDESTVSNQQIGIGDGATTDFALTRPFGSFSEPVGYAVPTAVTVNGVTASYTLLSNRIVRISPAPAASLIVRWSGSYAYRVRFLNGRLPVDKFMKNFWSAGSVSLLSKKV